MPSNPELQGAAQRKRRLHCLLLAAGAIGACHAQEAALQAHVPAPGRAASMAEARELAGRLLPAQPHETVLVPRLRSIVLVGDPVAATRPAQAREGGIDTSHVPLLAAEDLSDLAQWFIGRPASLLSLERVVAALRHYLQVTNRRFVTVYLPPQDLTDGVVRIVVQQASLEGTVAVSGGGRFAPAQYENVLSTAPGQPIDDARVGEALDRLNRNPFRRAAIVAEPGAQRGTTRLTLKVEEREPWTAFAALDNSGSPNTGLNRWSAGFSWGDAFGRGDQLFYQVKSDPSFRQSVSHAGGYITDLARGTLSINGAWSRVRPDLGPLFGQVGHSWQVSGRYSTAAPAPTGWQADVSWGADLKYSDNTIDFAAVPVVNNATHVAQAALSYAMRSRVTTGSSDLSATVLASPGSLGGRNNDASFSGSRLGATARYLYARLDGRHQRALAGGWTWVASASAQIASSALLGSEQLAGGGTGAVRGFLDSAAFGDSGVLLRNEIHLPRLVWRSAHSVDVFVFVDAARLLQRGGVHSSLSSTGIGLNYELSGGVSLSADWGKVLQRPAGNSENGRIHLRLRASF